MFSKQKAIYILFLFITLKLITLTTCLESEGIKIQTKLGFKGQGLSNAGEQLFTKTDGKLRPRFGRLLLGRAALNYREEVNPNIEGKDGLLKPHLGIYSEYEGVGTNKLTDNETLPNYWWITMPRNLSQDLKNVEAKTEASWNGIKAAGQIDSDRVKDVFSQSNGCTPGEMDIRSADGIHSGSMAYWAEFQSDSAHPGMEDGRLTLGKVTDVLRSPASPVNEGWLRTMALVQCRSNNMSLTIKKTESAHLMIDQGDAPPLPLSPMLLCGYSVETSWRDLEFTTLYDGCHIRQEDGRNVLSLIWRGTPVKMSCPVRPRLAPLSLCCDPFGMTITVAGSRSAAEIGVDVGYGWRSLASVAEQCRYIMDAHPEKLVVSVPFSTCGVTFKDQKYTLSLQSEEGESVFTCPAPPSAPVSAPNSPPSSHIHHPQPSPTPHTDPQPPHPGHDTANPPTAPEVRTPKSPMFSWHQPHLPEGAARDNFPDTRPAESPYLHPRVPILYPEPPRNPTTNPRDPPLPNLLMYPPNPAPTARALQSPAEPPYTIPVSPLHEPPNPHPSPRARTLVPDDCVTRDLATVGPSPTLSSATGPPPPAGPRMPFPLPCNDSTSTDSQNPHGEVGAHLPSPPHPLPRSRPHGSPDHTHQPHEPMKSPSRSWLPVPHHPGNPSVNQVVSPYHHSNPAFNHEVHPLPAHHHSNPFVNQEVYPRHHGDPSFNSVKRLPSERHLGNPSFDPETPPYPVRSQGNPFNNRVKNPHSAHYHDNPSLSHAKNPQPEHRHDNPSISQAKRPLPAPPCPAASRKKASATPVPLAPPVFGPRALPPGPQGPPPFLTPPSLSCRPDKMAVALPTAHPSSIAIKDQRVGEWIPIGRAEPDCAFSLRMGETGILTLTTPLPPCYSCSASPLTISLHVQYWDLAVEQMRTVHLKCLHSPDSSPDSPTAEPPRARKLQVYCMADHMSVRLPPGVWDVFVQDIKGNEIRLLDAPGNCEYAVKKHDGDGTVLTLPYKSCHMATQGPKRTIGVRSVGERGSQAEWLSCPVVMPVMKQDCGFPGEVRQVCGPGCAGGRGSCPESGPCYPPTHGYMADEGVAQSGESPSPQASGPVRVELKIGTDQNYTSYYSKNSRRFRNLLGRPLYLELRVVNPPDPVSDLALLVHFCLAHWASAHTPWLIYHSCQYPQRPPASVPPTPVRNFTITAFEHPPLGVQFSPDEEVRFWCSAELCSPVERPCLEGCFA